MGIKHNFISQKTDGSDSTQVQPSNWNANHVFDEIPSGSKIRIPVLIESKTLSLGTTTTTFSDLNGDADREYLIEASILFTATDTHVNALPNGLTTNQGCTCYIEKSGAATQYSGSNGAFMIANSAYTNTNALCKAQTTIYAKTGTPRIARTFEAAYGSQMTNCIGTSVWNESTTNITSLVCTVQSGTYSGTIELYKMVTVTL